MGFVRDLISARKEKRHHGRGLNRPGFTEDDLLPWNVVGVNRKCPICVNRKWHSLKFPEEVRRSTLLAKSTGMERRTDARMGDEDAS